MKNFQELIKGIIAWIKKINGYLLLEIKIKKLNENAIIPTNGSVEAAGYDLHACVDEEILLCSGETAMIPTGLTFEIPKGYWGGIYARSGLAFKHGLRPCNCVGVIDSDYRGEVKVALYNDSPYRQKVKPNERIAQIILQPHSVVKFKNVEELEETIRGQGGFGSSGM